MEDTRNTVTETAQRMLDAYYENVGLNGPVIEASTSSVLEHAIESGIT